MLPVLSMYSYCSHSDRLDGNSYLSPAPPPTQDLQRNSELIAGDGVPVPRPGPPPVRTPPHKNDPGLGPAVSDLLSGRWRSRIPASNVGGGKHIPGLHPHVPPFKTAIIVNHLLILSLTALTAIIVNHLLILSPSPSLLYRNLN